MCLLNPSSQGHQPLKGTIERCACELTLAPHEWSSKTLMLPLVVKTIERTAASSFADWLNGCAHCRDPQLPWDSIGNW